MPYIVRGGSLLGFPELVESLGESPLALFEAEGIEPSVLKTPDAYLPYPALARVLTRAADVCGRPDFGALLASRQGLHVLGALASQLSLQPTLGRALTMIQRHVDFHARGVEIVADGADDGLRVTMDFAFARQVDCTQLAVLSVGLLARALAQLHGGALRPRRVDLRQPPPGDTGVYGRLFGPAVAFGRSYDRLVYDAGLTALPVRVAPALRDRLGAEWRGTRRERPAPGLPLQVERAIVALLPTGDCCLDSVARMVDLHPRVLQRRLRDEGTSFGAILRAARETLAREHLARSDIRLTDLAMHLGFGDLAVFSRSFKRWTGVSPRDWRRRQRAAAADGDRQAGTRA
ncbi:AraC family transcriptional regulator [Salinisphaera sp. PC39]|uniref:AraC family transcriptional regulator n=1 Tax=Salinisphaera sp. PC39 TaxID=1304156 RepID=UPI00333FFEA3